MIIIKIIAIAFILIMLLSCFLNSFKGEDENKQLTYIITFIMLGIVLIALFY